MCCKIFVWECNSYEYPSIRPYIMTNLDKKSLLENIDKLKVVGKATDIIGTKPCPEFAYELGRRLFYEKIC